MNRLLLCAALLLTALPTFAQGVKVQWATTNTGPVVTNIVRILSSNLLPNRLSATNTIPAQLRVYAATNINSSGFWLDPTTLTPGAATNVIDVAAGDQSITIVTNSLLRTLTVNGSAVTNLNYLSRTLYVDATNGVDGTAVANRPTAPWKTVSAASRAAYDNDTIFLLPGYFVESNDVVIPRGGVLRGSGTNRTTLVGYWNIVPPNTEFNASTNPAGGAFILMRNRSVLRDLYVLDGFMGTTNYSGATIGIMPDNTNSLYWPYQSPDTEFLIDNVFSASATDNVILQSTNPASLTVSSCVFTGKYDNLAVYFGPHRLRLFRSRFDAVSPNTLGLSGGLYTNFANNIAFNTVNHETARMDVWAEDCYFNAFSLDGSKGHIAMDNGVRTNWQMFFRQCVFNSSSTNPFSGSANHFYFENCASNDIVVWNSSASALATPNRLQLEGSGWTNLNLSYAWGYNQNLTNTVVFGFTVNGGITNSSPYTFHLADMETRYSSDGIFRMIQTANSLLWTNADVDDGIPIFEITSGDARVRAPNQGSAVAALGLDSLGRLTTNNVPGGTNSFSLPIAVVNGDIILTNLSNSAGLSYETGAGARWIFNGDLEADAFYGIVFAYDSILTNSVLFTNTLNGPLTNNTQYVWNLNERMHYYSGGIMQIFEGLNTMWWTNTDPDDGVLILKLEGGAATFGVDAAGVDDPYGVSWDGNFEFPTKNALYDKIQTISGGTPGGSDTQVQYNDGGAFGAEAAFTYNKTSDILTVPNFTTTGTTRLGSLAYAYGLSAGGVVTGYLAIAADGELRAVEAPSGAFYGPFTNLDIYTNFDLITHSPNGFSNFWAFNASHTNIQVNLTNQAAGSVSYISVLDIGTNGVATSLGWLGDSVRTTNFPAPRTLNYEADKTNVFINAGLANENRWKFTMTATNHFLLQITNAQFDMQEIVVRVKQDATGNWQGYTTNTISGGDSIPIPADKSLSILPAPPTANKVTYLGFIYNSTSNVWHYTELREGF